MTGSDLITKYELYVDDQSQLSSTESLALANKKYRQVLNFRPWSFLFKTASGTLSTSVPYVALPADFKYLIDNYEDPYSLQPKRVVFVGTDYEPYEVIPYNERRNYRDREGYCYLDMVNSRLYFTSQPTAAESYEFDYIYKPDDLATGTSPVFHSDFHDIIYHGMCADHDIIQQTEKGLAYAPEHLNEYERLLGEMIVQDEQNKK